MDDVTHGRVRRPSEPGTAATEISKTALFWDESFLWGLIAHDAFSLLNIDFNLVTAEDIRAGGLAGYDVLFVPGGWASNKIKALGEAGTDAVKRFVSEGGAYLGFCGGAGLALDHQNGLGLAPVGRKPTRIRVPSFSGKIRLNHGRGDHPMWRGVTGGSAFYAWWPGMFSIRDFDKVDILATYGQPEDGSYVSDVRVERAIDWAALERRYNANLDPARIEGEPAVIETSFGSGRVVLSYLHFETPGDVLGHAVLVNLLTYLANGKAPVLDSDAAGARKNFCGHPSADEGSAHQAALALEQCARGLMDFGEQHGLWFWREPWVIQWRRGVRGIEYLTLYSMLHRLSRLAGSCASTDLAGRLTGILPRVTVFADGASRLLTLERDAMEREPITPLTCNDPRVQELRERLFANKKSFGGFYKEVLDDIDALVLELLKNPVPGVRHP